jgi:hypothetical protein
MIYQDVYSSIQAPTSMYGLRKQVEQDQLTAQENELILKQKQNAFQKSKIVDTYKALNTFSNEPEESKAAQWPTVRAQIVSLSPEMEQKLPKDWMSDPVGNQSQLQAALKGMSSLITPERITLKTDEVIQERLPGGKFATIASGPQKKETGFEIKRIPVDGGLVEIPQQILPSGNILAGPFVYDQFNMSNSMPKEEYFKLYPSERPVDIRPESQNKLNATPQPVPGQTELPPRQFNAPSPTNRAGETNVGYGIDENAMLQQPQIMPSMGNMMLKGAGAVMADEFAPQPRNALVGGMMPQPSQFAELMPAGSAPNRFGSPGVEGIDFAATGSSKPQLINGLVVYPGRPKPGQQPPETSRDMTAEEIVASGRDPAEFSGQITSLGEKKFSPIPLKGFTKTQLDKMQQELENLKANAKTEAQKADVSRKEKLFVLRNLKEYEYALQKLENNPMFDTGPLDQFISARTPLGQQIVELGTRIEPLVRKVQRTPGDPAAASETAAFGEMLPKLNKYLQNNFDNLNKITQYYLDLYGANAMVNSKSEYDALYSPDQDIVYIDLRDGKRYVKPKGKK